MKKIFILAAIALMGFASCADSKQSMTVTVTNPLALERTGEMVEVPMSDVTAKLQLADTAQIVVLGEDGQQVPYQVTYDEKVVFLGYGESKWHSHLYYPIRYSRPV